MGHWYDLDGQLHAYVPRANGTSTREATLADARKNGWLPSVTGILSDLAKPQLADWRVREAIKVALGMPEQASEDEVVKQVQRASEAYRDWSAEFGSAVHAAIHGKLTGIITQWQSQLLGVEDIAEAFLDWIGPNGVQVTESELSFSSSLGYGGTIDLLGTYYGEPFIGDIKTQDWGAEGDKNKRANWYDPEWPLQLAGYELGWCNPPEQDGYAAVAPTGLLRLSFVLSRTRPGLIEVKQWPEPERYDAAWLALLETWAAIHKWGKWAPKTKLELLQGGLELEDA